jgi:hypothetical protein
MVLIAGGIIILLDVIIVAGEYFYFMLLCMLYVCYCLLEYFLIFKYFRAHPSLPRSSEKRTSYSELLVSSHFMYLCFFK